ncbi:MAG: biotin--[acetyl-CoA-carboxylase] ligase [Bowdeniella nasicola]|nr:biotin--[acetyl-CoA-carboxylase] ligase [Bowdeniella nasicola]
MEWLETIDSTNAEALRRLDRAERCGALASLDQRSGRGRGGASWSSRGGLALTLTVEAGSAGERAAQLTHVAGLAARRVLAPLVAHPVALAWPNDVVVRDPAAPDLPGWGSARKLAGILCERHASGVVAIGIGVNLTQALDTLPVPWATSLALCGLAAPEPRPLAEALATEIGRLARRWQRGGADLRGAGLLAELNAAQAWCGQVVTATRTPAPAQVGATQHVRGTFTGVDAGGRALIRTDGGVVSWLSGEVRHLRSADPL